MTTMNVARATLAFALSASMLGCGDKKDPAPEVPAGEVKSDTVAPVAEGADTAVVVPDGTKALFAALPARYENADNALTDEKIALGKTLFFDARLSKNHDVSCNSCHGLDTYGVDGKPTSSGHKGQLGGRNSPTVYNAGAQLAQFWDGRAKDLEEQAKGPVLNPVEMAMKDEKSVVAVLNSMPEYVSMFKGAFPGDKNPVSFDNMAKAIGAFERTLVTPGRFDKYLGGDDKALTDDEKKGLALFASTGCVSCHMGAHVGGMMYQKVGVLKPWPNQSDLGRFDVTKNDADKLMFKVPTLRNIAKTAPYFHDGATATLDDAVKMMAEHQLGKTLTDDETKLLVAFLGSLTGDLDPAVIKAPTLPKSTKKTPKPSAK